MDGAGDLLVDPDLYVIFTDGLDRRFETDIFLFELEFVLLLESFADILAGDGAKDAAVFPALDFDDDLDSLELGGHDDGFVCCDLALEFFRFLTLGGGIEVCLGAFYAEAFANEHVAAIRISDFDDVALLPKIATKGLSGSDTALPI